MLNCYFAIFAPVRSVIHECASSASALLILLIIGLDMLRLIGYVGLAVLTAIVLLCIYLSLDHGDWRGVGIGVGALVMFAFFGNTLWVSGLKEKRPYASVAPNRTILGIFMAFLGLSALAGGVERLIAGSWLSGCVTLVVAVVLLDGAFRALRSRL